MGGGEDSHEVIFFPWEEGGRRGLCIVSKVAMDDGWIKLRSTGTRGSESLDQLASPLQRVSCVIQ